MADPVTTVVEMAVGAGCLVVSLGLWRRGLRWVAGLLVAAGLAAIGHAAVALAG